jgi:hypothetical protein
MNKKIINFIFTLLLIRMFVISAFNIWLVFLLIVFCGDWLAILWLTDKNNDERKQNESL